MSAPGVIRQVAAPQIITAGFVSVSNTQNDVHVVAQVKVDAENV